MGDPVLQVLIEDREALQRLIGRKVQYLDICYEITDLLIDEDLLVLSADEAADVQEDCFGRAHRMVPKQQNLKFRDSEGRPTHIWEEIAFLDGPLQA